MAEGEAGPSLEFTPTYVVAITCILIVSISLIVERSLHKAGKILKQKEQRYLYEALQKIKEELMLLGFISLLLVVFQGQVEKWCIKDDLADKWLPCNKEEESTSSTTEKFLTVGRHLLAEASSGSSGSCKKEGHEPFLSLKALHDLHIFIFVLAVVQVSISALTVIAGGLKIRQWRPWEKAINAKIEQDESKEIPDQLIVVQGHDFIKKRFWGVDSEFLIWVHSFFKHLYGSITKSDYTTLRAGFITMHCKSTPKFKFHKYILRAFEADFKDVVGLSWYLWLVLVIFLLVDFSGWNPYFYIAFLPLILLIIVGTKLEHIITQFAHEVASKHSAIVGSDIKITPSDEHFWFGRPKIMLVLINIIFFQNSFEIAIFFWVLCTYGLHSCIMGNTVFLIPRLIIAVLVQIVCSYSTLPLYAIVTQMGSSHHKAIFDDYIQGGISNWVNLAKKKAKNRSRHATKNGKSPEAYDSGRDPAGTLQVDSNSTHRRQIEEDNGEIKLIP